MRLHDAQTMPVRGTESQPRLGTHATLEETQSMQARHKWPCTSLHSLSNRCQVKVCHVVCGTAHNMCIRRVIYATLCGSQRSSSGLPWTPLQLFLPLGHSAQLFTSREIPWELENPLFPPTCGLSVLDSTGVWLDPRGNISGRIACLCCHSSLSCTTLCHTRGP